MGKHPVLVTDSVVAEVRGVGDHGKWSASDVHVNKLCGVGRRPHGSAREKKTTLG